MSALQEYTALVQKFSAGHTEVNAIALECEHVIFTNVVFNFFESTPDSKKMFNCPKCGIQKKCVAQVGRAFWDSTYRPQIPNDDEDY